MVKFRTVWLASALVAASWIPASAQTKWNFANAYAPTEFQSQGYDLFAEKVKKATNGGVEITLHHNGSLFKNPEILQATRTGLVDMGTQLMTNLGRENALWDLDGVPFFVTSYDEAKKLWKLSREPLSNLLAKSGLRLLFAAPWPSQGFFFKRDIKTLDDVKGVRMRAYNASTTELAKLMGAEPQNVQMTEVPQAFATGLISSMNTSPTSGVVYSLWDYSKYYLKSDAWIPKQMVFVREDKFKALTPDQQKAVLQAAAETEEWLWAKSEDMVSGAEKTLVSNGMIEIKPAGKLAEQLKEIGDKMLASWSANADQTAKGIVKGMGR